MTFQSVEAGLNARIGLLVRKSKRLSDTVWWGCVDGVVSGVGGTDYRGVGVSSCQFEHGKTACQRCIKEESAR